MGIYKLILNMLPILVPGPEETSALLEQLRAKLKHNGDATPSTTEAAVAEEETDDVPPLNRIRRRGRLSRSAEAHQEWLHKKTRRWYSVAAGAVAGAIAIRCESADRRMGIAQQMFVR